MQLVDMTCPNCGAKVQVDLENKSAVCEHCGSIFALDDEKIHLQYDNAEEAGYLFEKGRQRAQEEQRKREQETYRAPVQNVNIQSQKQPVKKRKTWLWVLGWICIFPLPLTILLLRKKDMKPGLKWGIIIAAWVIYIVIGASGDTDSERQKTKTQTESSTAGSVASGIEETKQEEALEEAMDAANISESTEAAEQILSGSEIIDNAVNAFNDISAAHLSYAEDFTPSDRSGTHYQTEFRLTAYKDAIGKSYTLNETRVDVIERDSLKQKGIIRVYAKGADFDDCVTLINGFSKVLSNQTTDAEIAEAVAYFTGNKEANGYYYGNLGLTITGNDENGYELMLKSKND